MHIGDTQKWERTFTHEDVQFFSRIAKDYGAYAIQPDEQGRLVVNNLLTATIPTKIGNSWGYMARDLVLEIIRPVFVGDMIGCEVTITDLYTLDGQTQIKAKVLCHNQQGRTVLIGHVSGIVREPDYSMVGLH